MPGHVYGKAKARSAFAASTVFIDSSPTVAPRSHGAKAYIPVAKGDDASREIVGITEALHDLILSSDGSESVPIPNRPGRRRVNWRNREPKRQSPLPDNEQIGPSHESEKENADVSKSQSPPGECTRRARTARQRRHAASAHTISSNEEPQDPYIAPLLALTREQTSPRMFADWSSELEPYFRISKIAEASYSEVYRLSLLRPHAMLTSADESVLKIIAIKPLQPGASEEEQGKEEAMTAVTDIVSEVRLLKRMTTVPGFTNYRAMHVLRGRPSTAFVKAWRDWNRARGRGEKSEFPDPGRTGSYPPEQYWAIIEMQDAGTDVERLFEDNSKARRAMGRKKTAVKDRGGGINIDSVWCIWDVFWHTALAIAKGESEAQFEHRDLHLGNVCVRARDGSGKIELAGDARDKRLGFTNLELTIIDYTLSRASMVCTTPGSSAKTSRSTSIGWTGRGGEEVAFHPLAEHPEIFQGDASQELQYQIYRDMQAIVRSASSTSSFCNSERGGSVREDWKAFHARTNLVWLGYMLTKMLDYAEYLTESETDDSAHELRREELWKILEQVADVLRPERISTGEEEMLVTSAAELVELAAQEAWLGEDEIFG